MTLSLRSAELADAERKGLKAQLIGQQQIVEDVKSQVRLIVHHTAAGTRTFAERRFETHQESIEDRLLKRLASEFPNWTKSLSFLLGSFDRWLVESLTEALAEASASERSRLVEPVQRASKQIVEG